MKLQSLTIIFIIIILPVSLVLSAYIGFELKTIEKQNMYNAGVVKATHDAIFSFEINTNSDNYSNNPETKRDIVKSAVKTFENSFSTTCNLGLYGNNSIEQYIPAMVFGMYDGFYMYAPYKTNDGYIHDLRNYVYYSEKLGNDIVIRYSLDNYVAISGTFRNPTTNKDEYMTKAGYLINLDKCDNYDTINGNLQNNFTYFGAEISKENLKYKKYDLNSKEIKMVNENGENANKDALNYYEKAIKFTMWFNSNINNSVSKTYLKIKDGNDPEDENSAFVQHKRQIMKGRIQSLLNSSIKVYSDKTKNNYKMPVFSEEDWQKIYDNISVITFVQGMNLGFKNYNSYCILNSTNNNEYVNPNLIYFLSNNEYHDIRCTKIDAGNPIVGYPIGDFEKTKVEIYENVQTSETKEVYYYKHDETACYNCINGPLEAGVSIYDYVRTPSIDLKIKKAYFSALARERYRTTKLSDRLNINY